MPEAPWNRRKVALGLAVTVVALALAALHALFDVPRDSPVTIALLALAALPWLGVFVRSLKLPGGVEITYPQVEEALSSAGQSLGGGDPGPGGPGAEDPRLELESRDAREALMKLGFGIERRLRAWAAAADLQPTAETPRLVMDLARIEALDARAGSDLAEIVALARQAADCGRVHPRAHGILLEKGGSILRALDRARQGAAGLARRRTGAPPGHGAPEAEAVDAGATAPERQGVVRW